MARPIPRTEAETAELIGIARTTLRRLRSDRTGPPYYKLPGGAIRYDEAKVLRWLEAQEVAA